MSNRPKALQLADVAICNRDLEWHSSATAELRSLYAALQDWNERTYWVQKTAAPKELGLHRADVLRARIENAYFAGVLAEREACAKVCEAYDDDGGSGEAWALRFAQVIRARGEK